MSANHREREAFVAQLVKALPDKSVPQVTRAAALLMRHAATHGRLAEEDCNVEGAAERNEKREQQIERRISEICAELGITVAEFGGDPRGYTVKVHLPTGAYNTWGGRESGYGVPQ